MDSTLNIASMNCRGLGEFKKRRDVFHYLREKNYSMFLLQDTHFKPSMEQRIKQEWGGDAYFSSYTTNARGVAIFFNNNIDYKVIDVTRDVNGNYLIVHIKMFDKEFVIANIYGPNEDNPDFYVTLEEKINVYGPIDNVIICGDWNLVMDFDKDCHNYRRRNNITASDQVSDLMNNLDLCDVWREKKSRFEEIYLAKEHTISTKPLRLLLNFRNTFTVG